MMSGNLPSIVLHQCGNIHWFLMDFTGNLIMLRKILLNYERNNKACLIFIYNFIGGELL